MRVYKDPKSPHWQYDFSLQCRRFRGSTGETEKRKAKIAADRIRERQKRQNLLDEITPGRRPQMTLDTGFQRFYEEVTQHTANEKTEDGQLERLLKRLGKETLFSEVDDDMLATYVARRRGDLVRKPRKPTKEEPDPPLPPLVSNRTVNADVELLRRIFKRAAEVWKIDVGAEPPKWTNHLLEIPEERERYLTAKEEEALFQHLRPDYHAMVAFAIYAGRRVGAIRRLTWKNVDFEGGVVTLRANKSRKPGGTTQTVRITSVLRAILQGEKGKHPIYVFTYQCRRSRGQRKKGERYPFSESGWRKDWRAAIDAAGIEDFRFHDLRHTFGTRLLAKTGNLRLVKDAMHHASLQSTMRYAHVLSDDVWAAVEQATAEYWQKPRAVDAKTKEDKENSG